MVRKSRLSIESLEGRSLMAFDAFLTLDGVPGETKATTAEVGDPTNTPAPIDSLKSGDQEDSILIGLLVPAVQKVREAAARMQSAGIESGDMIIELDNGRGEEPLSIKIENVMVSSIQDASDDEILIGLLLPAVRGAREAAMMEESGYKLEDVLVSSFRSEPSNYNKPFDLDLDFVDQDADAYLKIKLQDCIVSSYSVSSH